MINVQELRKALETQLCDNGRPLTIKQKINKIFDVKESVQGNTIKKVSQLDPSAVSDLANLTPAKLARDLVGSNFFTDIGNALANPNHWAVAEAAGSVSAQLMQPIDLWSSTVLGMFGLKVLASYQYAPLIYKQLATEESTNIPAGHKHIRAAYDGSTPGGPLAELETAPEVGIKPSWIWSPHTETYQHAISMTLEGMLSEAAAGQFESACQTVGEAIARNENDRGIDVAFGRVNTYCYNSETPDPVADTFKTSAGAAPLDYVNSGTAVLSTADDLNTAFDILSRNRDPVTGWRLGFDRVGLELWVHPLYTMSAAQIVHSISAMTPNAAFNTNTGISVSPNPLTLAGYSISLQDMTYLATDRMLLAGKTYSGGAKAAVATEAIAKKAWLFGQPRKSFTYEVLQALTSRTLPLTADDYKRRIVFRGDALVMSRFFVKEPRYTYLSQPTS